MQQRENRCWIFKPGRSWFDKSKHRRKKLWQTSVTKIRAVSREGNRLRAVKAIEVINKPETVRVRKADSKVARVVKVASKQVKEAVNRTSSISASRGESRRD